MTATRVRAREARRSITDQGQAGAQGFYGGGEDGGVEDGGEDNGVKKDADF